MRITTLFQEIRKPVEMNWTGFPDKLDIEC